MKNTSLTPFKNCKIPAKLPLFSHQWASQLVFVGCFCAIFFEFFQAGLPSSDSKILWKQGKTYDFGNIETGATHTAVFPFVNISTDTLTIETVRTTCGCMVAQHTLDPVPPGGEGVVEVAYQSDQRRSFRKKIMVFFDRQRKAEVLFIAGNQE